MLAGLASVPTWVRPRACARKLCRSSEFRRVCYRINILGSQLSLSSVNLVPAQAGKITVGLASHWPWFTDTVVLRAQREQGDEHPRTCPFGAWHHLPLHVLLKSETFIRTA